MLHLRVSGTYGKVRESHPNLTILRPVVTYAGRGVSKPGVIKSRHAIAFTGKIEPKPTEMEKPRPGELPLMPGIGIRPKNSKDKLDKMSRIDFSQMYTIEHNVKVDEFGAVAQKDHE